MNTNLHVYFASNELCMFDVCFYILMKKMRQNESETHSVVSLFRHRDMSRYVHIFFDSVAVFKRRFMMS